VSVDLGLNILPSVQVQNRAKFGAGRWESTSEKGNKQPHKGRAKLNLQFLVRALCNNLRVRDRHDDKRHGSTQKSCTRIEVPVCDTGFLIASGGGEPWPPRAEILVKRMDGI
jgi:hypothetical protein